MCQVKDIIYITIISIFVSLFVNYYYHYSGYNFNNADVIREFISNIHDICKEDFHGGMVQLDNFTILPKYKDVGSLCNIYIRDEKAQRRYIVEEQDLTITDCVMPQNVLIHESNTKYARINFMTSVEFTNDGPCMGIEGCLQSCTVDEFIYHESLVQPAALFHRKPRIALIMGGAEGATVRELLKHLEIETIVFVDIDEELVHLCRTYLPDSWRAGYSENGYENRVEERWEDIRDFFRNDNRKFDLIFGDITDSCFSMTAEFYSIEWLSIIHSRLNENGIFATHAGFAREIEFAEIMKAGYNHFDRVIPYTSSIDTFRSNWGFVLMTSDPSIPDLPNLNSSYVDSLLQDRIKNTDQNRYYDGLTHIGMFKGIPKHVRANFISIIGKQN